MSKSKQPPTDSGKTAPISALPDDLDPYALLNAGASPATVALPDFVDPNATVDIPATVDTSPVFEAPAQPHGTVPDMADPRVAGLYHNEAPAQPHGTVPDMADPRVAGLYHNPDAARTQPRADADPLLVESLEVFERIYYGQLLSPYAYAAGQLVGGLITKIRAAVCTTTPADGK